jgi:ATP-dependent RNA circularization protein (DNA/RNA ligase family)
MLKGHYNELQIVSGICEVQKEKAIVENMMLNVRHHITITKLINRCKQLDKKIQILESWYNDK